MSKDAQDYIEEHLKHVMKLLNIQKDVNNVDTPKRVAKMWGEMFSSLYKNEEVFKKNLTLFPAPPDCGVVFVKDIPFHSMCEHHWLPFMGKVSVKYKPFKKIIGLSKIPRAVNFYCHKPQVQERLTQEIGQALFDILCPFFLEVRVYDVIHTCVSCRGIESYAETDTVWLKETSAQDRYNYIINSKAGED